MKSKLGFLSLVACVCLLTAPSARADDESGRFHFDFGVSYVNGVERLNSALKSDVDQSGQSFSSVAIPVGVQLDPYYLFDSGFGIGATLGPTEVITFSNLFSGDANDSSAVIPIGADLRYEFLNTTGILPYARAGIRFPITVGDILSNGQIGGFAAGGIEFTPIHLGLEASFDSSTVRVNYEGFHHTVRPSDLMVTVFIHF